jgi:exodeoxyribonuclease X
MSNVLRILDFETNGIDPPAKVIEVGYCDLIQTPTGWTVDDPISWLCGADEVSAVTRAVHHITLAEIAGLEPFIPGAFFEMSASVVAFAAHNSAFESKFLGDSIPKPMICTYKAALRVWPHAPGHSNSVLRYWLEDEGLLKLDHHRAGPDAYVTAHVLKALLQHATGKDMAAWTRQPPMLPTCPIGDWRGKPWAAVEGSFLGWMINKPVEPDLVWNAKKELERRRAAA